MAYEIPGFKLGVLKAGEDLSTKQFHWVKLSSGAIVACTAITDKALGILQNAPTTGQEAEIMCNGVSKLVAGEAIAAGAEVGVLATARGNSIASGTDTTVFKLGVALTAAAADAEVISVLFSCMGPSRAA